MHGLLLLLLLYTFNLWSLIKIILRTIRSIGLHWK